MTSKMMTQMTTISLTWSNCVSSLQRPSQTTFYEWVPASERRGELSCSKVGVCSFQLPPDGQLCYVDPPELEQFKEYCPAEFLYTQCDFRLTTLLRQGSSGHGLVALSFLEILQILQLSLLL